MRIRKMGTLLAALSMTATAAACGGGSSGGKGGDTVTWMSWETTQANAAMDASYQNFTKSSGITMQRQEAPSGDYGQKLASLILSKKVPDFFWCSNVEEQTLASQGLLYDWTKYAGRNDGIDMSKFSPGAVDTYRRDGKLYGIPTLANAYGFFYNKKLFDQSGVAVPKIGWSYDDMFADAAALTGKNGAKQGIVTQWGLLTGPFGLDQYAVSAGGQPLTSTATNVKSVTADPRILEAAQRYSTAIKAGQISSAESSDANSNASAAFANGSIPLMHGGQWLAQDMIGKKLGFDWGFVPMPVVSQNVQPFEANGICSPTTLKNPDQVWKAITYLETTGFNDTMRKVPVAPVAYLPGSQGYFDSLTGQGAETTAMADAVKASLDAPVKVPTGFLDAWSAKALNITTATWNPAIDGKSDTVAGVTESVKQFNALASSSS
jgi:ABC-type glycerol-3-phosphate transport system substrate-binding protein